MTSPNSHSQPYYARHIFFCLNERPEEQVSCARLGAEAAFTHCKQRVQAAGIAENGNVRVNRAGCLGRCLSGPVAVVYPEGVWYTFVDNEDIDEIVDNHLQNGQIVERLRIQDL
ncbi:MAG: hypothetical protein RIR79_2164 [Pseudomonadota bacterium]|jgi:(2Fe-2S) ferredoxin